MVLSSSLPIRMSDWFVPLILLAPDKDEISKVPPSELGSSLNVANAEIKPKSSSSSTVKGDSPLLSTSKYSKLSILVNPEVSTV